MKRRRIDPKNDLEYAFWRAAARIVLVNLDEEVARHPESCQEVRERAARASSRASAARENLELLEARLYVRHSKRLEAGGKRATAPAIEAAVRIDPKRRKASKKLLVRQRQAKEWAGLVQTFHERGYQLRDAVALQTARGRDRDSVGGREMEGARNRAYDADRAGLAAARKNAFKS